MRRTGICLLACAWLLAQSGTRQYSQPELLGTVTETRLRESSGLAASVRNPGLYWSHNDGGDGPNLYLFDSKGASRGIWPLTGATNLDWEAIAIGPGPEPKVPYLYVGDIGDNDWTRKTVTVYRVPEPSASERPRSLQPEVLQFQYPDRAHDAEALMVHPSTGDLYIVNKARGRDAMTGVYKAEAPLQAGRVVKLAKVAEIKLPEESDFTLAIGRITDGSISPDGQHVVLSDYFRVYEAELPLKQPFDRIWSAAFAPIEFGRRRQGEAITYRLDGKAILATSEGVPCPFLQITSNEHPR